MRVAGTAAVILVAACETSSIVDPGDLRILKAAEARWKARPFADYSYEIRVLCFCPPQITEWTRVTVRSGVVTSAEAVDPDPNVPIDNLRYWVPIDSLFVDLRLTMTDRALRTYLDAIVVDYDPDLGYPTKIEYRAKTNVIDGGSQFLLRSVVPLN
jgi:hypothetical protein